MSRNYFKARGTLVANLLNDAASRRSTNHRSPYEPGPGDAETTRSRVLEKRLSFQGVARGVRHKGVVMSRSVIVAGSRTAIGKLSGVFATLSAQDLGGAAIKDVLEKTGVDPSSV